MKINNAVSGGIIGLFALAVYSHASTFPSVGQQVGPEVFPQAIAVGMMICAVLLIIKGLKARKNEGEGWVTLPEWVNNKEAVVGFFLVPISLFFYVLASEFLGFHITGFIMLMTLFLVFKVKPWVAVISGLISVFVIHYLFYTVLKVPLPWGLLETVAW